MSADEEKLATTADGKTISEIIPMKGMRRVIASRMEESRKKSPHCSGFSKMDMTELVAYKKQLAAKGKNISYTDMFVKICALALEQNPILNSSRQENEIIVYKSINIGVATSNETGGLLVPVIKNAEGKNLVEISMEIKELGDKVKRNRITMEDMTGSTFTVSSMGMFGSDAIAPIINMPEAAIIAFGAIKKEPGYDENDNIVPKNMAFVSISFDHSVMNGVPVAKFMGCIREMLKNPGEYLKVD